MAVRRRRPTRLRCAGTALLALGVFGAGCEGGGAFDELHRLEPDGSGSSFVRVSPAVLGSEAPTETLRGRLTGPGLAVERVREEPDGRLLAELTFESVEALCRAPHLRRECRYGRNETGELELRMSLPPRGAGSDDVPGDRTTGIIEVQPSARVLRHNSGERPRRGNRFRWSRPPDGPGPEILLVTEERTVLGYAVRAMARSAAIAVALVAAALFLLVREGRRRLRAAE